MKLSYHYMLMTNHMLLQKRLLSGLKDTGLTAGQPKVLDYLQDHDGANQKEIAAGCRIEAGSLTSVLNRMEEKGLVQRRMLDGNRRTYYIFLTEKGKELLHIVKNKFEELEEEAFIGISDEDKETFMKLFFRIYSNMTAREE